MIKHQKMKAMTIRTSVFTKSLAILVLLATTVTLSAYQNKENIKLDQNLTIFIEINESKPIQIAANHLAGDFAKIFGTSVRVVHSMDQCHEKTILVGYRTGNSAGQKYLLDTLKAYESFSIRSLRKPPDPVRDAIVLQGADMRGTIYAIYHFAQEFLGVDPFYYWTNQEPVKSETISVPRNTDIYVPSPVFKNRGWFINDEDLLTGWSAHPAHGIGNETWEKVYEALLRMKGNMIIPGTFIFPDEPRIQLAADYGIKITQHHLENLGLNTFRWPEDVPYSFTRYPDIMMSAYENAVKAYPENAEIVWVVGHRGKHDRSFWADDPYAPKSAAGRAGIIQEVIEKQVELIKKYDKDPEIYFNGWGSLQFIERDLMTLPEEVHMIWADHGFGIIRDDGRMGAGDGVYYHTAMFMWRGSQLCELVPLERIQAELTRAVEAGATNYLLVNTSDLRPVVMTTRATMEFAWDPDNWIHNAQAPHAYLEDWCTQKFGKDAAETVSFIYRSFFELPVKCGSDGFGTIRDDDNPYHDYERFQDVSYHKICRTHLYHLVTGVGLSESKLYLGPDIRDKYLDPNNMLMYFEASAPEWESLYDRALKAESLMPEERQAFYHDHLIQQIALHYYSTKMSVNIANMLRAGDKQEKLTYLDSALTQIDAMLEHQRKAEHGYWKGFYDDDRMVGVQHTKETVLAYKDCLMGNCEPYRKKILNLDLRIYPAIKAYQGDKRVEVDVPDDRF